jgi:hypothetical protein
MNERQNNTREANLTIKVKSSASSDLKKNIWIYSPALAASPSLRKRPGSRLSAFPRSSPSPARFSNTAGRRYPTTATSANYRTSAPISSLVGSRVSHSVSPGSVEARQITVTSGRKCCGLLKRQDPLGCLVKTLLASSAWNSTICFLTWKSSTTPHGRLLFRLVPLTPNTGATGSGLWPTPRAANPGSRPNGKGGRILEEEVLIAAGLRTRGVKLDRKTESAASTSGRLNPEWVEWLMGYPIGHTVCGDLETPSSRKSRNKSSKPS